MNLDFFCFEQRGDLYPSRAQTINHEHWHDDDDDDDDVRCDFATADECFNTNNLEVPHHTRLVVFQDMAMVHPASRPIVRDPGNLNLASRRKIYCILPANELRRFAIYFKNLKEEPVQMEGMVH